MAKEKITAMSLASKMRDSLNTQLEELSMLIAEHAVPLDVSDEIAESLDYKLKKGMWLMLKHADERLDDLYEELDQIIELIAEADVDLFDPEDSEDTILVWLEELE